MLIDLRQGFRSRRNMSRLERLWHPGTYTVGVDMPCEVAEAAIKAGAAVEIKAAAEGIKFSADGLVEVSKTTFRGRRARRGAPENKS